MPFCIRCGRELKSDILQCAHCTLDKGRHTPDRNNAKAEGQPLMVLCADRSVGIFKRIKAYAVFFGDQLVIAHLSREREKSEGKALLRAMKHKDQNLLQNVISRFNLWTYYGERYYDMNVQSILNEDPANFSLKHDEVSGFFFKANQEDVEGDDSGGWVGEIVIRAEGKETIDMIHSYRDTNCKIQNILDTLYGDKLQYRESEVLLYPNKSYAYHNRRFC